MISSGLRHSFLSICFSGETPNTHLAKRARDLASAYRPSYIGNYFSYSCFDGRILVLVQAVTAVQLLYIRNIHRFFSLEFFGAYSAPNLLQHRIR